VLSEHTDEDGATIFLQACKMGLEGIMQAALRALPVRAVAGLAEDQESGQPGDDQGAGSRMAIRCERLPSSSFTSPTERP
jgi:hypothetical protein